MKKILVTGGTGYIGSHIVVRLIESGYDVVILDNLSNSNASVIDRIEKITKKPSFIQGDVRDRSLLKKIFNDHYIEAVIHCAGYKAVSESVEDPLKYYENNVGGSISLLEAMKEANIHHFVFSSSATVYGRPKKLPINEDHPLIPASPYGETKLIVEKLLHNLYCSSINWNILILRYFNPVGAHSSGLIGEDPNGIPNNLMPSIQKVAIGELEKVSVFGKDYNTRDGSGVRDYIHVMDIAEGHLAALNFIKFNSGIHTFNLGTGNNTSVLELISAYEKASSKKISYEIVARRLADIEACWADVLLARNKLKWEAIYNLDDMCKDSWNWIKNMKTKN